MRLKNKFFVVILLAIILRIAGLFINPPSLYGDELAAVYDGYSILKTGYDQTGEFLPLTFQKADGRQPAYNYLSIPFISLFGPGILAARLVSVLAGIGLVLVIFLLSKELIGERAALATVFLAAISPWDLMLSRGGFETHLALFLTTLAIYLVIKSNRKSAFLLLSALFFALAINTYPTYKFTVPLVVIFSIIFFKLYRNLSAIKIVSLSIVGTVFLFVIIRGLLVGSETRFLNINIFSQDDIKQSIITKINYQRTLSVLPQVASLFHNKYLEYLNIFGENYLKSFSIEFLVISGDGNPRHNMTGMGGIYLAEIIFIICGIYYLLKINKKLLFFLLLILVASPIPTALTGEPHALRSSLMLLPLLILSGCGMNFLRKDRIMILLGVLIFLQFIVFTYKLYFLSTQENSTFWSNGAKIASQIASQEKTKYKIISTKIDNAEYAYLVYQRVDPNLVISQNKQFSILNGQKFKKFGDVYVGEIPVQDVDRFIKSLDGSVTYIGDITEEKYLFDHEVIKDIDLSPRLVVRRKE